jgi:autotransporter adhesin
MTTIYTIGKNVRPTLIVGGNSLTFSNNGINWYQSTTNIPLTAINTLEYNGTIYVAGGSGTTESIAYSDNGTTWYTGKRALRKSVEHERARYR